MPPISFDDIAFVPSAPPATSAGGVSFDDIPLPGGAAAPPAPDRVREVIGSAVIGGMAAGLPGAIGGAVVGAVPPPALQRGTPGGAVRPANERIVLPGAGKPDAVGFRLTVPREGGDVAIAAAPGDARPPLTVEHPDVGQGTPAQAVTEGMDWISDQAGMKVVDALKDSGLSSQTVGALAAIAKGSVDVAIPMTPAQATEMAAAMANVTRRISAPALRAAPRLATQITELTGKALRELSGAEAAKRQRVVQMLIDSVQREMDPREHTAFLRGLAEPSPAAKMTRIAGGAEGAAAGNVPSQPGAAGFVMKPGSAAAAPDAAAIRAGRRFPGQAQPAVPLLETRVTPAGPIEIREPAARPGAPTVADEYGVEAARRAEPRPFQPPTAKVVPVTGEEMVQRRAAAYEASKPKPFVPPTAKPLTGEELVQRRSAAYEAGKPKATVPPAAEAPAPVEARSSTITPQVAERRPPPPPTKPAEIKTFTDLNKPEAMAKYVRPDRLKAGEAVKIGSPWKAQTATKAITGEGRYAVAELDAVQHSWKSGFPEELQGRFGRKAGETRKSTEDTITRIRSQWNPDAVGGSAFTTDGAPIVTPELKVISGNGRTEAFNRIAKAEPEKAAAYRRWLVDNAAKFGVSPADIAKMKQPFLVRVVEKVEKGGLGEFIDDSNRAAIQGMSSAEEALADAKLLAGMVKRGLYDPEVGVTQAVANRFAAEASDNTKLYGAAGADLTRVENRIKPASLAMALGPGRENVLQKLMDPGDEAVGRIRQGIEKAILPMAGLVDHPLAIGGAIEDAVRIVTKAKATNVDVLEYAVGEPGALISRSPDTIAAATLADVLDRGKPTLTADVLKNYAAMASKVNGGPDLLGGQAAIDEFMFRAAEQAGIPDARERVLEAFGRLGEDTGGENPFRSVGAAMGADFDPVTGKFIGLEKDLYESIAKLRKAERGVARARNVLQREQGTAQADEVYRRLYGPAGLPVAEIDNIASGITMFDRVRGVLPPSLRKPLEDLVAAASEGKIGRIYKTDWFRPAKDVLHGIGAGAIYDTSYTAVQSLKRAKREWSERILPILKGANITEGSDMARSVAHYLEAKATDEDMKILGDKGVAAAQEIRKVYGDLADQMFKETGELGKERRLSDYMNHVIKNSNAKVVSPELYGAMKFTGEVKDPFLLAREGKAEYIDDVVVALDAYLNASLRHMYLDRPFREMAQVLQNLRLPSDTHRLVKEYLETYMKRVLGAPEAVEGQWGNAVKNLMAGYVQMSKAVKRVNGKALPWTRKAERLLEMGDSAAYRRFSEGLRSNVYAGALGASAGSVLTNLTQSVNTFAEVGARWTAAGVMDRNAVMTAAALKKAGMKVPAETQRLIDALEKSEVLAEQGTDLIHGSQPLELRGKVTEAVMIPFEFAERTNRQVAFFAGYRRALARGVGEEAAIKEGADLAAKTQFIYGSTDTPLAFQSPSGRIIGQLGSYGFRQMEYLSPIAAAKKISRGEWKDQTVQRMVRYSLATAALYGTAGQMFSPVRDALMPVVPDPDAPFGFRASGFLKFGVGPFVGAANAALGILGGRRGAEKDLLRSAALLVPGGRVAHAAIRAYAKDEPVLPAALGVSGRLSRKAQQKARQDDDLEF